MERERARTARIRNSTTLFVSDSPMAVDMAPAQVAVSSVVVLAAPSRQSLTARRERASLQFRKHAVEGGARPARDRIREPRRLTAHT